MYEYKCAMCGKRKTADIKSNVRRFCSKKCYGKHLRMTAEERNNMQNDPDLPPLTQIHDDGFVNLVKAIVSQASRDVLDYSPGTCLRRDAEEFLASNYFRDLTGLDGFEILCKLQDQYDKKHHKGD